MQIQLITFGQLSLGLRQRKNFDDKALADLAQSIATIGLLHAPVVRATGETISDNLPRFILVAGERRYRAISRLHDKGIEFLYAGAPVPPGHFPVTVVDETYDEAKALEAELDENLKRENLTWQEQVAGLNLLHELRKKQNPAQTFSDTAKELLDAKSPAINAESMSSARHQVSRAQIIAKHLDDPDVAAAKSERDAFKIIARKTEREFMGILAKKAGADAPPHLLHNVTCQQFFDKTDAYLPEGISFSAVIADPPYGVNAHKFGDAAKQEHEYLDTPENAREIADCIIRRSFPLCRPDAMLLMFCDIDLFPFIRATAHTVGWRARRTPVIWTKGSSGHADSGFAAGWRRTYELIFVAYKGQRPCRFLYNDVISGHGGERVKDHAAQKPASLYHHLLNHYCEPGEFVLDPCCGSGTIFPVATKLGLTAIGCEPDAETFNLASTRLFEKLDSAEVNKAREGNVHVEPAALSDF